MAHVSRIIQLCSKKVCKTAMKRNSFTFFLKECVCLYLYLLIDINRYQGYEYEVGPPKNPGIIF